MAEKTANSMVARDKGEGEGVGVSRVQLSPSGVGFQCPNSPPRGSASHKYSISSVKLENKTLKAGLLEA